MKLQEVFKIKDKIEIIALKIKFWGYNFFLYINVKVKNE